MPTIIRTDEVDEFTHAVAGLEIDFTRTDLGYGPAEMISVDGGAAQVSVGGLDFSAVMHSEPPADTVTVQLVHVNPANVSMCGVAMGEHRPSVFVPGTTVFGWLPAGVRATTVVSSFDTLQSLADDLGVGPLDLRRTRLAMDPSPQVRPLVERLRDVAQRPTLVEASASSTRLLESVVRALAEPEKMTGRPSRRRDSATIVMLAREHADRTNTWLPAASELCRAAMTSESSLRAAFVEVLGVPPSVYFQVRVLAELRRLLLSADLQTDTVASLCVSLGLTHFGRVAARYRALYGETPRETLRSRHHRGTVLTTSSDAAAGH